MQEHIAKTIEYIGSRIESLQRLVEELKKIDSPGEVAAVAPSNGKSVLPWRNKRKEKPLVPSRKPRNGGGELYRIAALVERLPEPFGTMEVATAARLETKKASNFITQSLGKGWLARMGHGEYNRTKTFPGKSAQEKLLSEIHDEIDAAKPKDE